MKLGRSKATMMKWSATMGLLAALCSLVGCDQQQVDSAKDAIQKANDGAKGVVDAVKPDQLLFKGIVIGESSEESLRRQAGKPEIVWEEEGGSKRLEYPRGPMGGKTWMVTINAEGKVAAIEQVLVASNIAKIKPGMTKDQVRRILGKPTQVNYYSLKKEEVWGWRWWETSQHEAFFNAHFADGDTVTSTSRNETPENENR